MRTREEGEPSARSRQLVDLDADHPGFRDAAYRERRDCIARIALAWEPDEPVPDAPYSPEEDRVWGELVAALRPLHERWACRDWLACRDRLGMDERRIPQLRELNAAIQPATAFRMAPVAGLVSARHFLEHLGRGIFLSTQYIRHHSRPLYTPEPDVVHELVGHAASLLDPRYAELSRAFGRAAAAATAARLVELERIYWFTLEFGVVREAGALKACGAGLLSGAGELARFASAARLAPFDPARMAATPYDPTGFQELLFVAEDYEQILALERAL